MDAQHKEIFQSRGEKGELTFASGDFFNGTITEEDGKVWFQAVDTDGRTYETEEMPALRLGLTLQIRAGETVEQTRRRERKEKAQEGRFVPSSFKTFKGA